MEGLKKFCSQFKLSITESNVLEQLLKGGSNREIAQRLFVTEKTIKFHITNINRKLGTVRRSDIVLKAIAGAPKVVNSFEKPMPPVQPEEKENESSELPQGRE